VIGNGEGEMQSMDEFSAVHVTSPGVRQKEYGKKGTAKSDTKFTDYANPRGHGACRERHRETLRA
jgi:hypothetical protein